MVTLTVSMFVWSCLSTAILIISLAVHFLQQLIVALLAVGRYNVAQQHVNLTAFLWTVWYELQGLLQTALIYRLFSRIYYQTQSYFN